MIEALLLLFLLPLWGPLAITAIVFAFRNIGATYDWLAAHLRHIGIAIGALWFIMMVIVSTAYS